MTQQDKATQDFFDYEAALEKQNRMVQDALKGERQRESQQLLDDFAKAAMQGLISNTNNISYIPVNNDRGLVLDEVSKDAYDIAQAMMQERERRVKGS